MNKVNLAIVVLLVAAVALFAIPLGSFASSHREAPMISSDPQADATDVYAYVSRDNPDTVTLIMAVNPFEEPAGGPNFNSFGDDVLYEIKVDNNGDAVEDVSYQFRFKTTVQNPNTFLYNTGPIKSLTDANWNVRQTYTLTRIRGGTTEELGKDLPVPPVNIGPKSTPDYAALSDAAVRNLPGGIKVWAGQADDPFFVELGGIFDLLTIRKLPGNAGGGVDGLAGYNVHAMALQVPITQLTRDGTKPANATAANAVIGVWGTSSRQSTKVLSATGGAPTGSGPFVQVSRLGAPLVNEVVIPVGKKDLWNSSQPKDDGQFANYVTNPELGILLNALYKINVPPQGAFGSATQRDDLIAIFLTGIPGLTQPPGVKPAEELRLNVAIPPTASPNAMGVLGGDNQGYPNGRRLIDDVTDISLKAVAGAAYPLFHAGFKPDATGVQLGDGVDANDKPFRSAFPYLALPSDGFNSFPHSRLAAPYTGSEASFPWWYVGGGISALMAGLLLISWRARKPKVT
jgi:hypothetical protein